MQALLDWLPFSGTDVIAFVVAAVLPGIPGEVLGMFGLLIILCGWKMAVFAAFFYYLLQFLIGGENAYD
jgi:hypothetical protein